MDELAALVHRCRGGDALAWEALVRRLQSRVFGLAYHYVRDREEARDLAQEIFVRVYQGLDRCRDDACFLPWMMRIGRNCCIDRVRRIKARPSQDQSIDIPQGEPEDDRPGPYEALQTSSSRSLVYRALDRLSDTSREMILLKEIQGLKLSEIAEMLAIPLGTVKSRSGRARVELARAIVAIDPSYGGRS
jgi:RNA polymerase sigma-70 factor (ECF subfamily)